MTKDELFKKFTIVFYDGACYGNPTTLFETIIAPYLAIPRSLRDDPPKDCFIALKKYDKFAGSGVFYSSECAIQNGYTHWIPFPELPAIDKDEQEFEEWWRKEDGDGANARKSDCRTAWMAARGKKA